MHLDKTGRLVRTDIWREGQWVDLWSVVHTLSGALVGFMLYVVPFTSFVSTITALVLFTAYEIFEIVADIEETRTNRFMDIVIGMVGFIFTYFYVAPHLSLTIMILVVGIILTTDVVLSIFGWVASHKATLLEEKIRSTYRQKSEMLHRGLARKHRRNNLEIDKPF